MTNMGSWMRVLGLIYVCGVLLPHSGTSPSYLVAARESVFNVRGHAVDSSEQGELQDTHVDGAELISGGNGIGRTLVQADSVTVVKTAAALQAAVEAGDPHIQVQSHLDLTTLDTVTCDSGECLLGTGPSGYIPSTVKSITADCSGAAAPTFKPAAGHAPLLTMKARQCLLLVDTDFLYIGGTSLWLDGLYVRLTEPRGDPFFRFVEIGEETGQLWMTGVTLQGNGDGVLDCYTCALDLWAASVYAEDCIFSDFDGYKVTSAYWGGTVSLVSVTLQGNTILDTGTSDNDALVLADAGDDEDTPATSPDTQIRLEGCTISGNTKTARPTLLADNRGVEYAQGSFFSDSAMPQVCAYTGAEGATTQCTMSTPQPLSAAGSRFLTAASAWLVDTQEAAGYTPGATTTTPPSNPPANPPASAAPPTTAAEPETNPSNSPTGGNTSTPPSPPSDGDDAPNPDGTGTDGDETPQPSGTPDFDVSDPEGISPPVTPDDTPRSGGSQDEALIASIAAVGALMIATVAAVLFAVGRKRRKRAAANAADAEVEAPELPPAGPGNAYAPAQNAAQAQPAAAGAGAAAGAAAAPASPAHVYPNQLYAAPAPTAPPSAPKPAPAAAAAAPAAAAAAPTTYSASAGMTPAQAAAAGVPLITTVAAPTTVAAHTTVARAPNTTMAAPSRAVAVPPATPDSPPHLITTVAGVTTVPTEPTEGDKYEEEVLEQDDSLFMALPPALAPNASEMTSMPHMSSMHSAQGGLSVATASASASHMSSDMVPASTSTMSSQPGQLASTRSYERAPFVHGSLPRAGAAAAGPKVPHATSAAAAAPAPAVDGSTARTGSSAVDTFDMSYTAATLLQPPPADAPLDDRMDFLMQQLDSIGVERSILDGLLLLGDGDNDRLQGGQAVVQMARGKQDGLDYAIKFFVSAAAFQSELGMYGQGGNVQASALAQFLPQVRNVESNEGKVVVDSCGHPLPPCIVMERGESLDLWAARAQPDRPQAHSMILQLALRLKDLHALGYVHRDLKPGNVMWLPRENRWTVIDFGCVSRTGQSARLGFSLAYAAPEVISAYRNGAKTMVAQEALDVWSLGVMAFELLTGEPALRMREGKQAVMDQIEGVNGQGLPWEPSRLTALHRRKLGIFKASIVKLLSRDPANRPSMSDFCDSCDRVLAGSTTVQVV